MKKIFYCPVNGYDCPYWKDGGYCAMVDEDLSPVEECDEAGYFFDEAERESIYVYELDNGETRDAQELLEMGYHFVDGEPVLPPFEAVD